MSSQKRKILIIVVSRIGDTLLTTPAIRAVRESFPEHEITLLAHPKRVAVLENNQHIDKLGTITKHTATFRGYFQKGTFEFAVIFYTKDRAIINFALRISNSVYIMDHEDLPDNSRIVRYQRAAFGAHEAIEQLQLVQLAGANTANLRVSYTVTPQEASYAREWLTRHFPIKPEFLICIQPISFHTKAFRNWPFKNFIKLMEMISEVKPNVGFVILGDKTSGEQIADQVANSKSNIVNACGDLSLRESGAIISICNMFIGVDTGPTHIAGALDMPMISIYHCAYPSKTTKPLQRDKLMIIDHIAYVEKCDTRSPLSIITPDIVFNPFIELMSLTQEERQ